MPKRWLRCDEPTICLWFTKDGISLDMFSTDYNSPVVYNEGTLCLHNTALLSHILLNPE